MQRQTITVIVIAFAFFTLVVYPTWPGLLACVALYAGLVVWHWRKGRDT